jgi:hypothetical protein
MALSVVATPASVIVVDVPTLMVTVVVAAVPQPPVVAVIVVPATAVTL